MVEWAPPGAVPAGMNDAGDDGHRMEEAWRGQVLGLLPGPKAPGMKPRRGRGDDGMALQAMVARGIRAWATHPVGTSKLNGCRPRPFLDTVRCG